MLKNSGLSASMRRALLWGAFFAGIILLLFIGTVLVVTYNSADKPAGPAESKFYKQIRDYDYKYRQIIESGALPVQLQELSNALDRLEKKTEGVESWLSVLKRRRQLSAHDSRYRQNYRQSSQKAFLAYPHSAPVAAIAAAAQIHNTAITKEGEAELRKILPLLAENQYIPMRLGLNVLLGDFKSPQKAAEDTNLFPDLSVYGQLSNLPEAEALATNLALITIIKGDSGAAAAVQAALAANAATPSTNLIRLAAEYYYDFGDLQYSAELFSILHDAEALSRQADALWLAGFQIHARNIWGIISESKTAPESKAALLCNAALLCKALYNLAITAKTQREAAAFLEQLVKQDAAEESRQYGLIRYSRYFDAPKAVATLNDKRGADVSSVDTLIDLEILKRRTEMAETARIIAETWLLLERYPQNENLHQWGVWYFDLQRSYSESALLLKVAARQNFQGSWFNIHEGLRLTREGFLDAAEETFTAIPVNSNTWTAQANLGRIYETYRAPSRALEQYEKAAAAIHTEKMPESRLKNASRIQFRISQCYRTLGKKEECRRALECAINLNPDNLSARLELGRLD